MIINFQTLREAGAEEPLHRQLKKYVRPSAQHVGMLALCHPLVYAEPFERHRSKEYNRAYRQRVWMLGQAIAARSIREIVELHSLPYQIGALKEYEHVARKPAEVVEVLAEIWARVPDEDKVGPIWKELKMRFRC